MLEFYGVRVGRVPGVYNTWDDCLEQVNGIKYASYKKFKSFLDAERYVEAENGTGCGGKNKKLICTLCRKSIVNSNNLIQCNNCETFFHRFCFGDRYGLKISELKDFSDGFICYACHYQERRDGKNVNSSGSEYTEIGNKKTESYNEENNCANNKISNGGDDVEIVYSDKNISNNQDNLENIDLEEFLLSSELQIIPEQVDKSSSITHNNQKSSQVSSLVIEQYNRQDEKEQGPIKKPQIIELTNNVYREMGTQTEDHIKHISLLEDQGRKIRYREEGCQTEYLGSFSNTLQQKTRQDSIINQDLTRSYGDDQVFKARYFYNSNRKKELQPFNHFMGGLPKSFEINDLIKLVEQSIGDKAIIVCYKLKTKSQISASFCISLDKNYLEELLSWRDWPINIQIRKFRGLIYDYLIDKSSSSSGDLNKDQTFLDLDTNKEDIIISDQRMNIEAVEQADLENSKAESKESTILEDTIESDLRMNIKASEQADLKSSKVKSKENTDLEKSNANHIKYQSTSLKCNVTNELKDNDDISSENYIKKLNKNIVNGGRADNYRCQIWNLVRHNGNLVGFEIGLRFFCLIKFRLVDLDGWLLGQAIMTFKYLNGGSYFQNAWFYLTSKENKSENKERNSSKNTIENENLKSYYTRNRTKTSANEIKWDKKLKQGEMKLNTNVIKWYTELEQNETHSKGSDDKDNINYPQKIDLISLQDINDKNNQYSKNKLLENSKKNSSFGRQIRYPKR